MRVEIVFILALIPCLFGIRGDMKILGLEVKITDEYIRVTGLK